MAKQVFAEGQPIPCISILGLPGDVQGFWSLWRIAIYTEDWNQQRMMPLFLNDDGRVFLPTARYTVYPFFGTVAENVGRLIRLQGLFAAASVQRRIKEQLGERETVSRATQRLLRCFVDWGVLQDTNEKGIYQPASVQLVDNRRLVAWLIEAVLIASNSNSQALGVISQTPALFPFIVSPINLRDIEKNQRLEFFCQGLDENMVMLRH